MRRKAEKNIHNPVREVVDKPVEITDFPVENIGFDVEKNKKIRAHLVGVNFL